MLTELRNWVKRQFSSRTSTTVEQTRETAQEARQDRADAVISLQKEVRRIQQEITDLSDSLSNGHIPGDRKIGEGKLASLQRELEQKQRDLAKYQARI